MFQKLLFSLDFLVVLLTNKLHLEALVTKFHFVGKSNISQNMQKKSVHATNMSPRVRAETKNIRIRVLFMGSRLILDLTSYCYLNVVW